MKLQKLLLIGFFLMTLLGFSQQKSEYRSISEMNADEKEMYSILQKSVTAFFQSDVPLFPFFKTYESDKGFVFSSLIYDQPNYTYNDKGANSATSEVSLHFTKWKEVKFDPNARYATDSPASERKEPVEFYLGVTYSKSNFSFQDKTLVSIKKATPYFESRYSGVKFTKSSHSNFINPLIYKNLDIRNVSYIDNDIAIIKKDTLYGIIDNKNKILVPYQYNMIRKYKAGFLVKKDKSYFFIDVKGNKISKVYDEVRMDFNGGYDSVLDCFRVKIGDKYTLINWKLEEKLPIVYDKIELFYYKHLPDRLLLQKNGKKIIFDIAKWEETNLIYDAIQVIDARDMIVEEKGKSGIVELNGAVILPIEYDTINYLTNHSADGVLLVISKNNKKALYVNRKFVTDFEYDSMTSFFSAVKIEKDKKLGLFNDKGKILLPIDFDSIEYNKKTKKIEATKNSVIEYFDFKELHKI